MNITDFQLGFISGGITTTHKSVLIFTSGDFKILVHKNGPVRIQHKGIPYMEFSNLELFISEFISE